MKWTPSNKNIKGRFENIIVEERKRDGSWQVCLFGISKDASCYYGGFFRAQSNRFIGLMVKPALHVNTRGVKQKTWKKNPHLIQRINSLWQGILTSICACISLFSNQLCYKLRSF